CWRASVTPGARRTYSGNRGRRWVSNSANRCRRMKSRDQAATGRRLPKKQHSISILPCDCLVERRSEEGIELRESLPLAAGQTVRWPNARSGYLTGFSREIRGFHLARVDLATGTGGIVC